MILLSAREIVQPLVEDVMMLSGHVCAVAFYSCATKSMVYETDSFQV